MYNSGVAGSARWTPYYVPVQEDRSNNGQTSSSSSSAAPRRAIRILGRKYSLTSTCYKYLEIGINVGPASFIEIILGDNRGNQIVLPHQTWKELLQKRACIEDLLQSPTLSPIQIQDLSIAGCKMQNITILKFSLSNTVLHFTRETINMLFSFDLCINHMFSWLSENVPLVDEKFRGFVNTLQYNNITQDRYSINTVDLRHAAQTIRNSDAFDSESLIDCELLACALPNIVHNALSK